MSELGIVFAGQGGQGVRFLSTLLGRACAARGKQVASSASYGPEVRGTFTRAEVIISDSLIVYPGVLVPDVLAVLSQEAYDRLHGEVPAAGVILYDSSTVRPAQGLPAHQHPVPAFQIAQELGAPQVANMVLLGAVVGLTGVIDLAGLLEALPARGRDINTAALTCGCAIGEGLRGT
ncbi:MAG: 2-oxoacid:acceptor oxidoreductase family protein [Anaerolineae bacterium]